MRVITGAPAAPIHARRSAAILAWPVEMPVKRRSPSGPAREALLGVPATPVVPAACTHHRRHHSHRLGAGECHMFASDLLARPPRGSLGVPLTPSAPSQPPARTPRALRMPLPAARSVAGVPGIVCVSGTALVTLIFLPSRKAPCISVIASCNAS
jgi:hypothetical protein